MGSLNLGAVFRQHQRRRHLMAVFTLYLNLQK
jgi:hypothetical protein